MEIKFISYTGQYPTLCSGLLTLEIDGVQKTFGYSYESCTKADYEKFWYSGGRVGFKRNGNSYIDKDEWQLNDRYLPDDLKPYGEQLIKVFNDNVRHGCCGGCL
jgi:hypothetical protein